MARRFSPEFNANARKIVKSFNQRVRRAEARGMRNLPSTVSLRDLKSRFTTESDLKKELSQLRKMNEDKNALQRHFLGQGAITNWEFNYLRDNLKDVKTFYDMQIKLAQARFKNDPSDYGLKQQVNLMKDRREYLNRNLEQLNYSELKTFRKYLSQYQDSVRRDVNYFDKYLKTLDALMNQSGVDKEVIRDIKKKINSMPPAVFIEMYRNHDVIDELFQVDPSPTKNEIPNDLDEFRRAEQYEREMHDVWASKSPKELSASQLNEVNEKASAINEKLDVWAVEAVSNLDVIVDKLSPSEQEAFERYMKSTFESPIYKKYKKGK